MRVAAQMGSALARTLNPSKTSDGAAAAKIYAH
jgi:hypothetical protein